jgi:hypothetical protein
MSEFEEKLKIAGAGLVVLVVLFLSFVALGG